MVTVSLFEQLAKDILNYYFKGLLVQDNIRPVWSQGLEIDRYYPQLGVAVEFQGPQHYKMISSMQTSEKFKQQLKYDSVKRELAVKNKIFFFPLSIYDFTQSSHQKTAERIRVWGMDFAKRNKDEIVYNKLARMTIGSYFDSQIFRRLEGIKNSLL
jgi:hypothetical protein